MFFLFIFVIVVCFALQVITDALLVLYYGMRSVFNFRTNLTDIIIGGPAAAGLGEGAEYSFYHAGAAVTLRVVNGTAVVVGK